MLNVTTFSARAARNFSQMNVQLTEGKLLHEFSAKSRRRIRPRIVADGKGERSFQLETAVAGFLNSLFYFKLRQGRNQSVQGE